MCTDSAPRHGRVPRWSRTIRPDDASAGPTNVPGGSRTNPMTCGGGRPPVDHEASERSAQPFSPHDEQGVTQSEPTVRPAHRHLTVGVVQPTTGARQGYESRRFRCRCARLRSMDDKTILNRISELVDEEHKLRAEAQAHESGTEGEASERLRAL